jgi:protein-tyrosine-phosphatase
MLHVLVISDHNSARGQIACTYLNELGGDFFTVECSGLEPKPLNPLAALVMREEGYKLNDDNDANSLDDFLKIERQYDIVITVCSREYCHQCPAYQNCLLQLHWAYDDPGKIAGNRIDRLQKTRSIRECIKADVINLIREYQEEGVTMLMNRHD